MLTPTMCHMTCYELVPDLVLIMKGLSFIWLQCILVLTLIGWFHLS